MKISTILGEKKSNLDINQHKNSEKIII